MDSKRAVGIVTMKMESCISEGFGNGINWTKGLAVFSTLEEKSKKFKTGVKSLEIFLGPPFVFGNLKFL